MPNCCDFAYTHALQEFFTGIIVFQMQILSLVITFESLRVCVWGFVGEFDSQR